MPIDYREIVENLKEDKVKQLLDSLGIPFQDTPTCLIMPTVCHHANIEEASNCINVMNSSIEEIISFNLPIENSIRNLVVIKKKMIMLLIILLYLLLKKISVLIFLLFYLLLN